MVYAVKTLQGVYLAYKFMLLRCFVVNNYYFRVWFGGVLRIGLVNGCGLRPWSFSGKVGAYVLGWLYLQKTNTNGQQKTLSQVRLTSRH